MAAVMADAEGVSILAPTAVRTRAPSATPNVGARAVNALPRMKMTRPARSAWLGRMSVLRMGAQQAKVMLKMVTSCAAVVVDTCRSEPISLRSPARIKVSVPTAKVMSVRGHSLFDILPTI